MGSAAAIASVEVFSAGSDAVDVSAALAVFWPGWTGVAASAAVSRGPVDGASEAGNSKLGDADSGAGLGFGGWGRVAEVWDASDGGAADNDGVEALRAVAPGASAPSPEWAEVAAERASDGSVEGAVGSCSGKVIVCGVGEACAWVGAGLGGVAELGLVDEAGFFSGWDLPEVRPSCDLASLADGAGLSVSLAV